MNIHSPKHFMEMLQYDINKGYTTLLSVLIASAVSIAIAITLLFAGINSSREASSLESSKHSNFFAKSCVEEALEQIRDSSSFTGSGNLIFGNGTCDYNISNTGGQNRLITATGTARDSLRRLRVTIDAINPKINITSWQEVADF